MYISFNRAVKYLSFAVKIMGDISHQILLDITYMEKYLRWFYSNTSSKYIKPYKIFRTLFPSIFSYVKRLENTLWPYLLRIVPILSSFSNKSNIRRYSHVHTFVTDIKPSRLYRIRVDPPRSRAMSRITHSSILDFKLNVNIMKTTCPRIRDFNSNQHKTYQGEKNAFWMALQGAADR